MTTGGESAPLVAVVTPVYNGAKYLRQTMESVQRQTYPNIVHVICNNGSTDGTGRIIEEFRDRPVPLLVFENETVLPLAANWDKAFSHVPAEAAYARLLCADDLIRADALEKLVAMAETHPGVELILSQDVFNDRIHSARLPRSLVHDGRRFVRDLLLGRVGWLAFHHFFVRLHPADRTGRFIEDYWSPDPHVVLRSALRGEIAYLHEPLAYNRIHADSVTGKELKNKGVQFQLVQLHLLEHFGREVFSEREFKRLIADFRVSSSRALMRWKLSGDSARVAEMRAQLDQHGCSPSVRDYVAGLLGWPVSSIRWRLNERPAGQHLDERQFVAMGASARHGGPERQPVA